MKTNFRTLLFGLVAAAFAITTQCALAQNKTIVLDNFEGNTAAWKLNDSIRNNQPDVAPQLVNLVNTAPGAPHVSDSTKSGLFTFKSAHGAWASANIKIDAAKWQQIGAQRLSFYLNAGGNDKGFTLQVRRHVTGQGDEVFKLPKAVRLDVQHWRKVVIPLSDFKSAKGDLLHRLDGVYLLQIVMTGSWDTRFFRIDQLQISGTGTPTSTPQKTPPKTTNPPEKAPQKLPPNTSSVKVDFMRRIGQVRSTADVSIAMSKNGTPLPLVNDRRFRVAIRELKPTWVRLDAGALSEMVNSSGPKFNYKRLVAATKSARSIGAKVLLEVADRDDWGLSADDYATFAKGAALAVNKGHRRVTSFELATLQAGRDIGSAIVAYNAARGALKKLSKHYYVGGITSNSRDDSIFPIFLSNADGIDFVTIADFGQSDNSSKPSDDQLQAAKDMKRLVAVGRALDGSKFRSARIFVITNLENKPFAKKTKSSLLQMPAAAWWSTYLVNVSRLADQIFQNDATNPRWGLLDKHVRAFPSYYAMWMWNTFVPSGSQRVKTQISGSGVTAMGVNSPTAHNIVLANTTDHVNTVKIAIRGFPVLRKARVWIYDSPQKQPYMLDLPNSPYQTIKLAPYAVAVAQFIEPPKKR